MHKVTAKRVFIDEDPNKVETMHFCPDCCSRGKCNLLKYSHLNKDVAVYKCSAVNCMYPNTDFKYKNYRDNTIYRYEIVSVQPASLQCNTQEFLPSIVLSSKQPIFKDTSDDSKAIAKLESELNDLLSERLIDTPQQNDSNSLFGSSQCVNKQVQKHQKKKKLSKVYEFIHKINAESDFKVPCAPYKSAHKKASSNKHLKTNVFSTNFKSEVNKATNGIAITPTQLKEFSSSFLRQIEQKYTNIKSASGCHNYDIIPERQASTSLYKYELQQIKIKLDPG